MYQKPDDPAGEVDPYPRPLQALALHLKVGDSVENVADGELIPTG